MGLDIYIKKRNFEETTEPKGGKSTKAKLAFVVQRHHASHLHYDFRLELDGVLKSWAVPKGPSLNPKDKRLAMMVEDHPYDYKSFEGEIPKGNYGAGVVTIFDEGTYEAIDKKQDSLVKGLADGNLKFVLHGKKLKGEFALVKMKGSEQNAWLLLKHKDRYAVETPYNSEDEVSQKIKNAGKDFKKQTKTADETPTISKTVDLKPMLAKLVSYVPEGEEWLFEEKLDGYRAIANVNNKEVILTSRNGLDFSQDYPIVLKALQKLNIDAVLDGEIIVRDKDGVNFQALQHYNPKAKDTNLHYVVFDVLSINQSDVTSLPLTQRKKLLAKLLAENKSKEIESVNTATVDGATFFASAEKKGWEGIIAKMKDSSYVSGGRNGTWQKIKFVQTQEAIIIGYTQPAGERANFGALVLAIKNAKGNLEYIGNCGTGFTEQVLKEVFNKLQPLKSTTKPISGKVAQEKIVTWVKPDLVCEVSFAQWTDNHHLRHSVFKGLRTDKKVADVVLEIPTAIDTTNTVMENEVLLKFGKIAVKLTNQNKIYWPTEKITKGQMVNYYREVAPYLLPHLKDRPLSLNRHPNGINDLSFFQKDLNTDQIPSWVKYAPLTSDHLNKEIDYLICNDEATLLWMANLGCIEINPWLSTYRKPNQPLYAVLDLDPHDISFEEVTRVALTAKELLDEMGFESFVKTSGSTGIHIFIPLASVDYEISKNFIHYLGGLILERYPKTTSLERTPAKRKNKIYLDYLQNRSGQTIVAPYSIRPKPGATVSTPLNWSEVNEDLSISDFTIFNLKARLDKVGDLWADISKVKNNIKKLKR